VALSFLYVAFRALLGALVRRRRGLDVKDVELLVLRVGCANLIGGAGAVAVRVGGPGSRPDSSGLPPFLCRCAQSVHGSHVARENQRRVGAAEGCSKLNTV
jgi:hypothetical protein